jgi:hypothetical protein
MCRRVATQGLVVGKRAHQGHRPHLGACGHTWAGRAEIAERPAHRHLTKDLHSFAVELPCPTARGILDSR